MGKKLGSVALFIITANEEQRFLDNKKYKDYKDIDELVFYKDRHKISDRTMSVAYEFSKLYNEGKIKIPIESLETVTFKTAYEFIAELKENQENSKENKMRVNVNVVEGNLIVEGEGVAKSSKIRGFLKNSLNAKYLPELKIWQVNPNNFFKDEKDLDKKQKMLFGKLLNIGEKEKTLEIAREKYYETLSSQDNAKIDARKFLYNLANIASGDYISIEKRREMIEKTQKENLLKIEELEQKPHLEKWEKENLEVLKKSVENYDKRVEHLDALAKDLYKLEELGLYKKQSSTKDENVNYFQQVHWSVNNNISEAVNSLNFKKEVTIEQIEKSLENIATQTKELLQKQTTQKATPTSTPQRRY